MHKASQIALKTAASAREDTFALQALAIATRIRVLQAIFALVAPATPSCALQVTIVRVRAVAAKNQKNAQKTIFVQQVLPFLNHVEQERLVLKVQLLHLSVAYVLKTALKAHTLMGKNAVNVSQASSVFLRLHKNTQSMLKKRVDTSALQVITARKAQRRTPSKNALLERSDALEEARRLKTAKNAQMVVLRIAKDRKFAFFVVKALGLQKIDHLVNALVLSVHGKKQQTNVSAKLATTSQSSRHLHRLLHRI